MAVNFIPYRTAVAAIDCQDVFLKAQGTQETMQMSDRIDAAVDPVAASGAAIFSLYSKAGSLGQSGMLESLMGKAISFEKKHESGFVGSDLEKRLKAAYRSNVIFWGVHTTTCILNSALHSCQRGFNTAVASDLIGEGLRGRNISSANIQERERVALNRMREAGVIVAPMRELLGL